MTSSARIYTILCVVFSILVVVGNLTYQKFVFLDIFQFCRFELSVGAILYPLTFLVMDLIAEFYGRENARFCVRLAVAMNIMTVVIIAFMDSLQATSWSKINDENFHNIFGFYSVAFIGSIVACYISQSIDIKIYLWLKKITKERFMWIRNLLSTSISLFVDTSIVIGFMTIFGALPSQQAFNLIHNSYSFKLLFILCSVPLFYILVFITRKLKNE